MWRKYFKLIKLVPGKVIVQGYGTIDFSGDVPVELCQQLWENDFEFLQITEEGKRVLYGVKNHIPAIPEGEGAKEPKETPKRARKKR